MEHSDSARDPIVLTEREWGIVRRVSRGESNDEIARALFISAATVHTHLDHIYKKLGLHGKAQLAFWHGLSQREGAPPGCL
jgi:DNA-binding NarL/FixJ family response regulator